MKFSRCFLILTTAAMLAMFVNDASANLLGNPGFETPDASGGDVGGVGAPWTAFGNNFTTTDFANVGTQSQKIFGNFTGGFNVSGILQSFAAAPGDQFSLSVDSFQSSSDPMVGVGASDDNWVIQKIAFFDAGAAEIGGVESTILDGTFASDVWFSNSAVLGVAPAGTVSVQALVLYLQPVFDGGAAFIDNANFVKIPEPSTVTLAVFGLVATVGCGIRRRLK